MSAQDERQVIEALERMLVCPRRGLCLIHEWMRRYGTVGASCQCFWRFSECLSDSPRSGEDLEDLPY